MDKTPFIPADPMAAAEVPVEEIIVPKTSGDDAVIDEDDELDAAAEAALRGRTA